jgi:hypothetical protein
VADGFGVAYSGYLAVHRRLGRIRREEARAATQNGATARPYRTPAGPEGRGAAGDADLQRKLRHCCGGAHGEGRPGYINSAPSGGNEEMQPCRIYGGDRATLPVTRVRCNTAEMTGAGTGGAWRKEAYRVNRREAMPMVHTCSTA